MRGRWAALGLVGAIAGCPSNPTPPAPPITTPIGPVPSPITATPIPQGVFGVDGVPNPTGLTVDGQGNVILMNGASASGFVAGAAIRYDLNLNPQATASMGQSVGATTLGASNSVWVVTLAQLKQLDASFNAGSNFKALPAATAAIQPTAIAVDSQNRIWVADQANGGIWRFTNLNPDFFVTIPVSTDSGQVNPAGLAVSTDSIWVSSRGDVHLYQRKLVDGSDAGSFILPAPARGPVVMAPNNLLWVSHEFRNGTNALAKFSLTGQLLRDYDVNQDVPVALAADSRGFVWAALRGISRVSRLTPADGSLLSYGSQWIVRPMAIAVDASGDAFVASPGASGSLARIPAAP